MFFQTAGVGSVVAQTVPVFLCLHFSSNPARPPADVPLRLRRRPHTGALNHKLLLLPQRRTADCLPKTLPLRLGEYLNPPTRPQRCPPVAARHPPPGDRRGTAPSFIGIAAAKGSLQPKPRRSSQRSRAPVWGRARRAGGTLKGRRVGIDQNKNTLTHKFNHKKGPRML